MTEFFRYQGSPLKKVIEIDENLVDVQISKICSAVQKNDGYQGPVKICPQPHTEIGTMGGFALPGGERTEEIEIEEIRQYVWPAFGLSGPVNFCRGCGLELLDACPKCDKPFEQLQKTELKFCTGPSVPILMRHLHLKN